MPCHAMPCHANLGWGAVKKLASPRASLGHPYLKVAHFTLRFDAYCQHWFQLRRLYSIQYTYPSNICTVPFI